MWLRSRLAIVEISLIRLGERIYQGLHPHVDCLIVSGSAF
ncbi:unnamed protein product [Acidithrix sp. C25]|nr:unnamed protein product [Acidithrix sp. C25]